MQGKDIHATSHIKYLVEVSKNLMTPHAVLHIGFRVLVYLYCFEVDCEDRSLNADAIVSTLEW